MNREHFDRVLAGARDVQDFLWGEAEARTYTDATWTNILEKRIRKLREVDYSSKHAHVEVRKRVLQVAATALAWLERLDALPPQPDAVSDSAAGVGKQGGA
jgi:hypothetical protein